MKIEDEKQIIENEEDVIKHNIKVNILNDNYLPEYYFSTGIFQENGTNHYFIPANLVRELINKDRLRAIIYQEKGSKEKFTTDWLEHINNIPRNWDEDYNYTSIQYIPKTELSQREKWQQIVNDPNWEGSADINYLCSNYDADECYHLIGQDINDPNYNDGR